MLRKTTDTHGILSVAPRLCGNTLVYFIAILSGFFRGQGCLCGIAVEAGAVPARALGVV